MQSGNVIARARAPITSSGPGRGPLPDSPVVLPVRAASQDSLLAFGLGLGVVMGGSSIASHGTVAPAATTLNPRPVLASREPIEDRLREGSGQGTQEWRAAPQASPINNTRQIVASREALEDRLSPGSVSATQQFRSAPPPIVPGIPPDFGRRDAAEEFFAGSVTYEFGSPLPAASTLNPRPVIASREPREEFLGGSAFESAGWPVPATTTLNPRPVMAAQESPRPADGVVIHPYIQLWPPFSPRPGPGYIFWRIDDRQVIDHERPPPDGSYGWNRLRVRNVTIAKPPRPTLAVQADYYRPDYQPVILTRRHFNLLRVPQIVTARQGEYPIDPGTATIFKPPWQVIWLPRAITAAQAETPSPLLAGSAFSFKPPWQPLLLGQRVLAVQSEIPLALLPGGSAFNYRAPWEQARPQRSLFVATENRPPDAGQVVRFIAPLPGVQPVPARVLAQSEFPFLGLSGSAFRAIVPGFGPPTVIRAKLIRPEDPLFDYYAAWVSRGQLDPVLAKALKAYAAQLATRFVSAGQAGIVWMPAAQTGQVNVSAGQVGE
jgi:hypothetical protein